MSTAYKPNGGVLGCPRILAADFKEYSDDINSRLDKDGSLVRVYVAKLDDKEWDNDYDVYVQPHPDKVSIINRIFGPISNKNLNGTCYSAQIGKYHTDFIDLLHPAMGAPFYSASAGLVLQFLLKNSEYKLRATDLCCNLNGDTIILSTDPEAVYSFLGLDVAKILQTRTRMDLFHMIEQSWLYNPQHMIELKKIETKEKDLHRPVMVDFINFCETHPRISAIATKTLHDALVHFGKNDEYVSLGLKQNEENRQKKLRTNTKDLLMTQFRKQNIEGKALGLKMNAFKDWIMAKFGIDYDTWAISDNLQVETVFNDFYASS